MEDAKKKKDEWTQRLRNYEVESLLSLRDALLARGSMLTMSSADIKEIIRDIRSTVRVAKTSLTCLCVSNISSLPTQNLKIYPGPFKTEYVQC